MNDGYAKNFLLVRNLAAIATPQTLSRLTNEARQAEEKLRREAERAEELARKLSARTFTFAVKVGGQGQVFGSIHERDVQKKSVPPSALKLTASKSLCRRAPSSSASTLLT